MPELPLFPLPLVLYPGGLLPLRIFETRYTDMVGRCLREDGEFGVLLVTAAALARVGTSARIIDFNTLPDGLLGLMCRGVRRFSLQQHRMQSDGLYLGTVQWLEEPAPSRLEPQQRRLAQVLQRVLEELGDTARHLEADFEDAGWVANRLAELLPLERSDQQTLLEMSDPQERLRHLAPLIEVPEDPPP